MKQFTSTFFSSIFLGLLAFTFIPLLLLSLYTGVSVRDFATDLSRYELLESARFVARVIDDGAQSGRDPRTVLANLATDNGIRLTLIKRNGTVIFDSVGLMNDMENHIARPEIREAFETGSGSDFRRSATIGSESTYAAVRIELPGVQDGPYVVRTSLPLTAMGTKFAQQSQGIYLAMAWLLALGVVAAVLFSRRLRKPLSQLERMARNWAEGNFDSHANILSPYEFHSLSVSMNSMAEQLKDRIAALKASKDELWTVIEAMGDALLVSDETGHVRVWNAEANKLFSALETSRTIEKNMTMLEATRSSELASLEILCRSGISQTTSCTLYNPRTIHVQIQGAPLPGGKGAVIVVSDITRMMQLETVRRDFVANVSHELKTPIQSIRGFVESLQESAEPDAQTRKRFLDIILRNTLRMESIIADLLVLARLEHVESAGGFSTEAVDVAGAVKAAIELLPASYGRSSTVSITGAADVVVKGNAGLIEQALLNLLDNAMRYTPEDAAISVTWQLDGTMVAISVCDKGPGIPLRDQERIFERFYRIEKSRNRESGGTGLGLAIVRHVAHLHHGTAVVMSKPGEGACFTIRLPLWQA